MNRHFFLTLSVALLSARMTGAYSDERSTIILDQLETLAEARDYPAIKSHLALYEDVFPTGPIADVLAQNQSGFLDYLAFDVAHRGRGPLPWAERPGNGRPNPPPRNPTIY